MIGGLHFNGTPLQFRYKDLTEKQRAFLELAYVEYKNEERRFLIELMGGKVSETPHSRDIREEGLRRLKDPRELGDLAGRKRG